MGRPTAQAPGTNDDIFMIVAHSKNRVIGKAGDIPWRLRDDLRFFKEKTTGHTVVMGRKTFQSIGKPLPGRKNVVITRDTDFRAEGVTVVHSPKEALNTSRQGRLFIIGGQQIYEAFLPVADVLYVTLVDAVVEGDARFPKLGPEWNWSPLRRQSADEHNEYPFVIYEVRRSRRSG